MEIGTTSGLAVAARCHPPPRDPTAPNSMPIFPRARLRLGLRQLIHLGLRHPARQDGWIERLSHKLGCRVANYGVDGYGTDQAYVRFTA